MNTYPVKGCAPVQLTEATIGLPGLPDDRNFLIISPEGVFRSQRRDPRLAVIQPQVSPDQRFLTLQENNHARLL